MTKVTIQGRVSRGTTLFYRVKRDLVIAVTGIPAGVYFGAP